MLVAGYARRVNFRNMVIVITLHFTYALLDRQTLIKEKSFCYKTVCSSIFVLIYLRLAGGGCVRGRFLYSLYFFYIYGFS